MRTRQASSSGSERSLSTEKIQTKKKFKLKPKIFKTISKSLSLNDVSSHLGARKSESLPNITKKSDFNAVINENLNAVENILENSPPPVPKRGVPKRNEKKNLFGRAVQKGDFAFPKNQLQFFQNVF